MVVDEPVLHSLNDRSVLARAARPTLQRIEGDLRRLDEQGADIRVREMLRVAKAELFSPKLSVRRLRRSVEARDNSVSARWSASLGTSPSRYLRIARLEVAERLLVRTQLRVWRVAELVGFSSVQVFSRAFFQWQGMTPGSYRQRSSEGSPQPRIDPVDHLRRILDGHGTAREACALISVLSSLYGSDPGGASISGTDFGSPHTP